MLFMLPFVTVLREGLEAVVFVGGVSVVSLLEFINLLNMIDRYRSGNLRVLYRWLRCRVSSSG